LEPPPAAPTLRALLARARGGVALLTLLQLAWLMALPVAIYGIGGRVGFVLPLATGAAFNAVRLVFQQSLRHTLRRASMVQSARDALERRGALTEASTDAAFWTAHVAEFAVATTVPALAASAIATVCILALATVRLGLRFVVPVAGVLAVAGVAGLLVNRRLGSRVALMVRERANAAAWMAAATRDVGELGGPASREPFLARVSSATDAWCVAEDRYERRRAMHRGAIAVGVVAALIAVAWTGGVDLRALTSPASTHAPWRALIDVALFATSVPVAFGLARQLDALLTAREELRQLVPTTPRRAVHEATVALADRPLKLRARSLVLRHGEHVALRIDALEASLAAPLAVLGVNGAGKTTLAAIVAGALEPSEGELTIDDAPAASLGRDQVAYVPQEPVIIESLTIAENMRLVVPDASDADLSAALESLGLTRAAIAPAGNLSRGERQRIAIARALLKAPRLLVLDEPDAWLDATGRRALCDALRGATQCAIVLVTHRADMLDLAGSAVLLAADHTIAAVGTPAELARSSEAYRRFVRGTAALEVMGM
jgi:ABC-type transport system involved in cytochrome bd biosynthesis fused ATPase/permease subunit